MATAQRPVATDPAPRMLPGKSAWRPRPAAFLGGVALAALLAVANCIGRTVVDVDIVAGPSPTLAATRTTVAGWPFAFVTIGAERLWPLAHLDEGIRARSIAALLANVGVAAVLAAIGAVLLEQRLRSRRRWWQFGLFDLAGLATVVGVVLAVIVLPRAAADRDRSLVGKFVGANSSNSSGRSGRSSSRDDRQQIVWQPGTTAWLRSLAGESLFPDTNRVIALETSGANLREIAHLQRLRVVRLYGTVTDADLSRLARLPDLQALDLTSAILRQDKGGWLAPPSFDSEYAIVLPQLRRLYCQGNVLQGSDLARLANLEELHLAGTIMDLPSAETIRSLSQLRILDLHDSTLDDEQLAQIAELPALELLDISGTAVTDAGLACLTRAPRLRTLLVKDTAVSDSGLAALAESPSLSSVHLRGSRTTPAGQSRFAKTRPDCLIVP
jgi:hypothetical protein